LLLVLLLLLAGDAIVRLKRNGFEGDRSQKVAAGLKIQMNFGLKWNQKYSEQLLGNLRSSIESIFDKNYIIVTYLV